MYILPDEIISYISEYSELKERYNLAICSKILVGSLLTYSSPLAKQLSHYYAQRPFTCKLNSVKLGYNESLSINRSGYFWTLPIVRGSFWSVHINKILKISHNNGSRIANVYYLNPRNEVSIKPLIFKTQTDIQDLFIRFGENTFSRYMEKNNI